MDQFRLQRLNPILHAKIGRQHFCIDTNDLNELIKLDRLTPVLIKCGNGRFTCPAQDVIHWIDIIDSQRKLAEAIIATQKPGSMTIETDYVRSVEMVLT